jgi:hypothetical protein
MFGLGTLLGHLLPDTALATFTYILLSYHLVLAFKVFTADKKAGLSLPIGQTILTHLACVGVLVGLAIGRHQIPFFGMIRLFIPGLAPFEAEWLFSGGKAKIDRIPATDDEAIQAATVHAEAGDTAAVAAAQAAPSLFFTSTGEEYNEFLELMRQGKRPFRKPGISIKDEFELWLAARAKSRAAAVPADRQTV